MYDAMTTTTTMMIVIYVFIIQYIVYDVIKYMMKVQGRD